MVVKVSLMFIISLFTISPDGRRLMLVIIFKEGFEDISVSSAVKSLIILMKDTYRIHCLHESPAIFRSNFSGYFCLVRHEILGILLNSSFFIPKRGNKFYLIYKIIVKSHVMQAELLYLAIIHIP